MCDENVSDNSNATSPAQGNEPIQITVYPNPNSGNDAYVSTKYGTTISKNVDFSGNSTISLYMDNDELFEYVEKNIQHCNFELLLTFDINSGLWCRINNFILQYSLSNNVLGKDDCYIYFKLSGDGIDIDVKVKITKNN